MGSGSRIDHQSHPIAPTVMPPAPAHGVDPTDRADQPRHGRIAASGNGGADGPGAPGGPAASAAPELDFEPPPDSLRGRARADLIRHLRETGRLPGPDEQTQAGAAEVNPAVARAAARDVLADIAAETAASAAAQAAAAQLDEEEAESTYEQNPDLFHRDMELARERVAAGGPAVEYMRENATGGLGARDGGRGFGVEIEFELPARNRATARAAIAQALHEAGLTRNAEVGRYHDSQRRGYTESHAGGWTFEQDSSVSGGEIVSPIMYDTPETWANLERVCQIIRDNGGRVSRNTGGHVHVSAGDYDHTVENHNRLLANYAAYEDVLYRLSQNPDAAQHRGTAYCRPNVIPTTGYEDIDGVRNSQRGHGIGLNMQSMFGRSGDHVEFRMFDGSLNPAVIQTQIKVALGTVETSFRQARNAEPPAGGARHRLGTHATAPSGSRARAAGAAVFRAFADAVFPRAADRRQATSLYAATRWQSA